MTAVKPKLLVLGTGWGGTSLLRALRRPEYYDITIASARDHMLFTPLLTSTATGALEHRSILEPIRPLATQKGARFLNATAVRVDSNAANVHFVVPDSLARAGGANTQPPHEHTPLTKADANNAMSFVQPYDVLVAAVGATVNTFGIPGVSQHALFMKEAAHARAVRRRMHDCFEAACLPVTTVAQRRTLLTFVVCGAGPTGVELAAEMADWLRDVARSRRFGAVAEEGEARVVLVEASGNILSSFDRSLREYALRRLRAARVDVRLGAAVREVEERAVVLGDAVVGAGEVGGGGASGEERLPCGMVVWTAGVGPRDVIAESDLPTDGRRRHVSVDDHLLAVHADERKPVFAIGDCASIMDNPLVPIAQVAEQQGIHVAHVLDAVANGGNVTGDGIVTAEMIRAAAGKPFRFASKGMLAYVGAWRGVAAVATGGGEGDGNGNMVRSSGFVAWLIWRLAYFSKLGSFRNKLQVPLDWLKTALFGRDVSSF